MKKLLIGIDLSFNSTGISFCYVEDDKPQKISFHRVIFDAESNVSGKVYKPQKIKNINNYIYRMPTNIFVDNLLIDNNDTNNKEQLYATLRSMVCSKNINKIILSKLQHYNPNVVICTMENYIMPSFSGPNSLKNVSGLLMLQTFVREFIIKYKLKENFELILYTPTPTQNKKFFCLDGKATKDDMLTAFVELYDGKKLIPNLDKGKLDDVIDSFSLMVHGYSKYIYNNNKYHKNNEKYNL